MRRHVKPIADRLDEQLRFTPEQRKQVEDAILREFDRIGDAMSEGKLDVFPEFEGFAWLKDALLAILRPDQRETYERLRVEQEEKARRGREDAQRKLFDRVSKDVQLTPSQIVALNPLLGPALGEFSRQSDTLHMKAMFGQVTMEDYKARQKELVEGVVGKAKAHLTPEQAEALRIQLEKLSTTGARVQGDVDEGKKE